MAGAPDFRSRVLGLNPARGGIQLMIAQSLSLSLFHHLSMTDNVERDVK